MRIYQRKSVWYVDYSFNGRRVRKRVGTSKKMADAVLKDLEVKTIKGEFLGVVEPKKVIFDKLCEEYLHYCHDHNDPQTYRRKNGIIRHLLKCFSGKLVSQLTAHDIECYKKIRIKQVTPASVNREIACIKHMFTIANHLGYLNANPLRTVKCFKEKPARVRYLTQEETEKLLDCCTEHIQPIVIMALNTGMRKGEILNLKWSDIDMKNQMITVRKTKNNEMRMIPINDTLYNTLKTVGPEICHQYVFTNNKGKPYRDIKAGFAAARKRAKIKDFRFHDLRHTFASHLVMAGVDIRTVQELMGHKDIRMTMRYSHLSDAHLKEAVKKLEVGTNLAQEPFGKMEVLAKH